MKKTAVRNNIRKMPGNAIQSKAIHSQSPTHKKLLKKIELTQREASNQYEFSLQDNLVFQKPQEEVVDFRVEIERRFQKSIANHTYVFPRNREDDSEEGLDNSTSSQEGSLESLRHVTVYELVSQNKKKAKPAKSIYKTQDGHNISGRETNSHRGRDLNDYRVRTEPDHESDSEEEYDVENPATPIEIKIRDKNSTAYKNLITMLERQLNRPPSTIPTAKKPAEVVLNDDFYVKEEQTPIGYQPQIQMKDVKIVNKDKRPATNLAVRNSNLTKDESQRSIGYYLGKSRIGDPDTTTKTLDKSESVLSFHETHEKIKKTTKTPDTSQRLKMQVREKVSALMESSHHGESMLSLDSRLSPNAKRNDLSRVSMESKKKVYSMANANNLLRALTPKYMANKNISGLKESSANKVLKPQNQAENYLSTQTPSSNLYQKAQDDVLNGKLRVSTQKTSKRPVTNENEIQRDDQLRTSDSKGINFTDFYGSPKGHISKLSPSLSHTMYNNLTKTRNMRKMEGSMEKSSERHSGYISYDINGKKSSATKPAFKLDLSNRIQKQRDLLSSTRTRDNQSKEKSSDMMSIDSILKTSYDMQNHSLIRNASKQAEISKRKLGVTPKGNLSKNSLLA